jgi:hypothetical protein
MEAYLQAATIVAAVALVCAGLAWTERLIWRRQRVRAAFAAIVRELGMDPAAMRHTAGGGSQVDAQGRTWGTTTYSKPDDEYDMYMMDQVGTDGNLVTAWTRKKDLLLVVRGIPETITSQLDGERLSALIGPRSHTEGLRIVETSTDKDGFIKVRARRA